MAGWSWVGAWWDQVYLFSSSIILVTGASPYTPDSIASIQQGYELGQIMT